VLGSWVDSGLLAHVITRGGDGPFPRGGTVGFGTLAAGFENGPSFRNGPSSGYDQGARGAQFTGEGSKLENPW
jgi:hypothetical protein